jgi:hypothetical protein
VSVRIGSLVLWHYKTIHLCVPSFFRAHRETQERLIIHEILHFGGADDGESGDDWRNADILAECIQAAAKWR